MRFRTLWLALSLTGCIADLPVTPELPDAGPPPEVVTPGVTDAGAPGLVRAKCVPAPCRAEVVASGGDVALGIAADAQHVYWAGGSPRTVRRWPTAGGAVQDFVPPTEPPPFFVTSDAQQVAWTVGSASEALWRTERSAGGPGTRVASFLGTQAAPVATGGFLYFATGSGVWRSAAAGGEPQRMLGLQVSAFAADESGVYAVEPLSARLLHGSGEGDARELATLPSGHGAPSAAVDAQHVYLLLRLSGPDCRTTVARAPKSGGPLVELVTEERCGMRLVVDETHVYWLGFESGGASVLSRIPKEGGSAELLAGALPYAWLMAQNATHVYWTEQSPPGRVLRIAK